MLATTVCTALYVDMLHEHININFGLTRNGVYKGRIGHTMDIGNSCLTNKASSLKAASLGTVARKKKSRREAASEQKRLQRWC